MHIRCLESEIVEMDYEEASGEDVYATARYDEVTSTTVAGVTTWTFVDGGETLSFDGSQQITLFVDADHHDQNMVADVAVSHDSSDQYWAYEAITDTYHAVGVDGLAVYEDGSGNRYEHDTVLDSLSSLITVYEQATGGNLPPAPLNPIA